MRSVNKAIVTSAIVFLAAVGIAEACGSKPNAQRCLSKAGADIDGRQPSYGGMVACDSTTTNSVQYDLYGPKNPNYLYYCSYDPIPCSSIQQSDPQAYADYC